jgi:acetyltransferase EpsM
METANPVQIPLLNPNEPEAMLAAVHVTEGQHVDLGQPICTLETTKSTAEVAAEAGGYIRGLRFGAGETVQAGEVLCYLAGSADWEPPQDWKPSSQSEGTHPADGGTPTQIPAGLRISKAALSLARQEKVNLDTLPIGPMVTEKMVRTLIEKTGAPAFQRTSSEFDPTAIIVYGGGGHGKSLIDLLRTLGTYQILGVVDDGRPKGELILGLPVLGDGQVLAELYSQGVRMAVNAVGGIGNVAVRIKVFQRLAADGFACPAVVHPTAFIEPSARLSPGVQVLPHAYVGSDVHVGFGTIVNTGAIVSHDCQLGDFVNISPGAILAGEVEVGEAALVGMGVTINLQAKIGAGARIGNSATVKSDVPEKGVVRAGSIWPE